MKRDELFTMLGEMKGDIKAVVGMLEDMKEWQTSHEKKDSEHFGKLHDRINGMNKYAASIAAVSAFIGAGATWIWKKATGQA